MNKVGSSRGFPVITALSPIQALKKIEKKREQI